MLPERNESISESPGSRAASPPASYPDLAGKILLVKWCTGKLPSELAKTRLLARAGVQGRPPAFGSRAALSSGCARPQTAAAWGHQPADALCSVFQSPLTTATMAQKITQVRGHFQHLGGTAPAVGAAGLQMPAHGRSAPCTPRTCL